jgi:hypothetical protein
VTQNCIADENITKGTTFSSNNCLIKYLDIQGPNLQNVQKQSIFVNVCSGVDQFVKSQEVDPKYGG